MTYGSLNGETKILKNGFLIYEDVEGNVPYGHEFFAREDGFENELRELDSLFAATKDLDYLSDKGVVMIILKQYDRAILLYLEIEKLQPNRYSTASNIGTAYELAGQNENALKWITRAIEIDSTSHDNSEWIHAKILEVKIKGEKYLTTNYLLNTDFGDEDRPVSQLSQQELMRLSNALYFQLNERVSFVEPKERVVAQLLFDLGNIAFLLGRYNDAFADYGRAKEYGFNGQPIERRITLSGKLKRDVTIQDKGKSYLFEVVLAIGAIAFVGVIVYKKRIKVER